MTHSGLAVKHLLPALFLLLGTFKLLPGLVCLVVATLPTLPLWIKLPQGRSRMILARSLIPYSFPCVILSSFAHTNSFPAWARALLGATVALSPSHHCTELQALPAHLGLRLCVNPKFWETVTFPACFGSKSRLGEAPGELSTLQQVHCTSLKDRQIFWVLVTAPWDLTLSAMAGFPAWGKAGHIMAALGCSCCWTLPFFPQTGSLTRDK